MFVGFSFDSDVGEVFLHFPALFSKVHFPSMFLKYADTVHKTVVFLLFLKSPKPY